MTDEPDNPFTSLLRAWDDQHRHRPLRALKRDDLLALGYRNDSVEKRTCRQCGRTFYTVHASFCSERCQQDDRNETRRKTRAAERDKSKRERKVRRCEVCGAKLDPVRSTLRYCSDACRQQAYRERQRK